MVQSWLLYNRANIHDSTWKAFFVSSMMHQLRLRYSSCDTSNVFLMFVFVYLNWFICIFSLVHQLRLMYPAWWHVKCVLHSVCDKTVSSKNLGWTKKGLTFLLNQYCCCCCCCWCDCRTNFLEQREFQQSVKASLISVFLATNWLQLISIVLLLAFAMKLKEVVTSFSPC